MNSVDLTLGRTNSRHARKADAEYLDDCRKKGNIVRKYELLEIRAKRSIL